MPWLLKGWHSAWIPHPGYFGERGCELLKRKEGSRKKRGKRLPFEAQGIYEGVGEVKRHE